MSETIAEDDERAWGDTQEWLDVIDGDEAPSDPYGSTPPAPEEAGTGRETPEESAISGHGAASDAEPGDLDEMGAGGQMSESVVDLDDINPNSVDGQHDSVGRPGADDDDQAAPLDSPDMSVIDGAREDPDAGHPPRYNKAIALGFVAATVVATLVVTGALLAMRARPHAADSERSARPSTQLSVVAAPSASAAPVTGQDSPIPYTAAAVGCLPGSTTGQSVAGGDPTQAWVCVHGGTVGQYLVLELGRTMVITAVSITPGWVGANTSGADQWLQHRVLTRVQWSFNDTPPTVVSQETHSVHGEAPQPIPGRGVIASRIILLVQDTARAPAQAATSAPPSRPGGLFGDVLGTPAPASGPPSTASLPGSPGDQTDPADNTFAVSSVKIFGHPPQ